MHQLVFAVVLSVIGLGSAGTALAVQPAPDGLDPVEPYLAFEDGPVLIDNVLVLDGAGGPAQSGMSVLLEDGRIARLAPSGAIEATAGASTVVDAALAAAAAAAVAASASLSSALLPPTSPG